MGRAEPELAWAHLVVTAECSPSFWVRGRRKQFKPNQELNEIMQSSCFRVRSRGQGWVMVPPALLDDSLVTGGQRF